MSGAHETNFICRPISVLVGLQRLTDLNVMVNYLKSAKLCIKIPSFMMRHILVTQNVAVNQKYGTLSEN